MFFVCTFSFSCSCLSIIWKDDKTQVCDPYFSTSAALKDGECIGLARKTTCRQGKLKDPRIIILTTPSGGLLRSCFSTFQYLTYSIVWLEGAMTPYSFVAVMVVCALQIRAFVISPLRLSDQVNLSPLPRSFISCSHAPLLHLY